MRPDGSVEINGYVLAAGQVPLWQRAMAVARAGDLDLAINTVQEIVAMQPDFVPARLQVAYFMLSADRYRDARRMALLAADGPLASAEIVLELTRLLRRFEEHERISLLFARTEWAANGSADFLLAVVGELGPIGLYEQAQRLLDQVEILAPDHPRLATLRGTVQLMSGDADAARHLFRQALKSGAALPHVRWMLTLQPDEEDLDRQVFEAQRALAQVAPGSEDEAYLWYALHNLHHAAGRYEEAWSTLVRGGRIKRSHANYSRIEQHRLFGRLKQVKCDQAAPAPPAGKNEYPRVIFIVGMHRSGTSIVERILSGHSEVSDGGESYVFTAAMREATNHFGRGVVDEMMVERASSADWRGVGKQFLAHARWRANGSRWFTEKLPSNFLNLGFILQALPDAVVLHMRRDPIDTCFSNLRTFFSQAAPYSYDQSELADYFLQYVELMRHWHAQFPGRILDVDYEEFVADPEAHARRVMSFCGLTYEPEALDVHKAGGFTATASVASVRRGILKDRGAVWTNYQSHLQPLLEGLGRD